MTNLYFAQVREDPLIELDYFSGISNGRFFTIASGGCTALSLLLLKPAEIVAADINPAQEALVALKAAAVRRLGAVELRNFLGIAPSGDRTDVYQEIRRDLSIEHCDFWDRHLDWIAGGIQYAGRTERFYRVLSKILRLTIHSEACIRQFFHCRDMESQRRFYKDTWCNFRWRTLTSAALSRSVQARVFPRVTFAQSDERDLGDYFYRVTERAFQDIPIWENYFLSQIMLGEYLDGPRGAPPYLQAENLDVLKSHINALRTLRKPLHEAFTEIPTGSLDGLALSNVFDWQSEGDRERTCREILRAARPGARVLYRNLVASPSLPQFFIDQIQWDESRSREYQQMDRAFIYKRLKVGTVLKKGDSR